MKTEFKNFLLFQLVLFCLLAVAAAAPQFIYQAPRAAPPPEPVVTYGAPSNVRAATVLAPATPPVPILLDEREGPDADGEYSFNFQTGDGISRQEEGDPLPNTGAVAVQGGWTFTFPDGSPAQFRFVADANGYRVESPLLPTAPPMPAHALAQIEKARLEDEAAARAASASSQQVFVAPQQLSNAYGFPQ
ncbi:uncharacterized protein LOC143040783 [Oratosquilla oratoria]|uniref:uncharacterized protein LOC143040783 n=1 Tax=Oratosquilla oratoria TaxID=337810 RepID=UPI003F768351